METHSHSHSHSDASHSHSHDADPSGLPELTGSSRIPFLYIDAVAGASGDMFLGALVDLGADFDALTDLIGELDLEGVHLIKSETFRHSIAGTKVDVIVENDDQPHRHVGDLLKIIAAAPLADRIKERSEWILRLLAEAESQAHRMPVEEVHLHEVGGIDCLVDVVGTCIGLELLGVDTIVCGPVAVGTGVITCAHGKMPEPAPGTLAILKDLPIRKLCFEGEMTTPTGAAIIAALSHPTTEPLLMTPRKIGYGAGTKDKPEIANLLRLILADAPAFALKRVLGH